MIGSLREVDLQLKLRYCFDMNLAEVKAEVKGLTLDERRQLRAFMTMLQMQEEPDYMQSLSNKIDDKKPENWVNLQELDQRLETLK